MSTRRSLALALSIALAALAERWIIIIASQTNSLAVYVHLDHVPAANFADHNRFMAGQNLVYKWNV